MDWEVDGFDLLELIGFGGLGEVWRALDRGSGQVVALRRLDLPDALEEVRQRAAVLRSIPVDHLVRVRSITADAVVLDHAAGGSLASLLTQRNQLTPGEVVTVVGPLARALAAVHERGLVHGRISLREVLLTRDGKPLLDGVALSFLYDERQPTDDVRQLAELARLLLGDGDAPRPLLEAIAAAVEPHSASTAADLGTALLASCPAEPLAGLVPADPPVPLTLTPPAEAPRPHSRRWIAVAALMVLAAAATVMRHSTPEATAPTAQQEPAWRQVLDGLDQARAAAFAAGDPQALAQVYVPGSAAFLADRKAMAQLGEGVTASGLRHTVLSLRADRANPLETDLHVTEALSGYDLIGPGTRVSHRPPGPTLTHVVALRRTSDGWRVERVRT